MTSNGGRRSRRNQRGRVKEEEFVKKVQEMMHVKEKQWIPIAQGLPWTIVEPEPSPPTSSSSCHPSSRLVDFAFVEHHALFVTTCSLASSTSCNVNSNINISPSSSSSQRQQHAGVVSGRLLIPTQPYIADLGSISDAESSFPYIHNS
ncbi:hypothetical protein Q3G72_020725 [Acer saccharum]|nr:hypothetical protein Q3G72_020725 [Acer saccharum]